jgi:transposase-like protein
VTDTNVIKLAQPGTFADSLTEILRNGARALLTQAVETEVAEFLGRHADLKTEAGHKRIVRHGHLPEREIMTGIGPVAVRQPRVRDREAVGGERIRFSPTILPPYARRTKSLEVLIPILYLKGISTGDFEEALAALLGKDAGGLSASTIARLKEAWVDEHARWRERDLSAKRYVYVWADGIYVQARLEDDAQCLLVIIGATAEGRKELVGLADGIRESAQSWRELLLDLKRRGLTIDPQLAVADGALGFWKAIDQVWPKTRAQRCWVHKTANVLNRLPKSLQAKAKRTLQEIWMAETRKAAEAAFGGVMLPEGQTGRDHAHLAASPVLPVRRLALERNPCGRRDVDRPDSGRGRRRDGEDAAPPLRTRDRHRLRPRRRVRRSRRGIRTVVHA